MVWSVWGRALVMTSVISITAWNSVSCLYWSQKSWSGRKNLLPSARIDYHLLSCKWLVTSTLSSTVCTLLWQSAYPGSSVHFPHLYLEGCWERDGWEAPPILTTSHSFCTLFILHLAAEWKRTWKHALVSHCPFELMLGIPLEAILSWKVSQFHKIKITP